MFEIHEWKVVVAAVAGGGVTALALLGFARVQRWRWRDLEKQAPLAELRREFFWWEVGGVVAMLVAMLISWQVSMLIAARHVPPAAIYYLGPNALHWAVMAFFAGNILAVGPTHILYRWLMGPVRYARFRAYQTRKFGYDSRVWIVPFSALVGSTTAVVAALMLNWGVTFTGEAVVIAPLAPGDERHYSYDRVLHVRIVDVDGRPRLTLMFDDSVYWTSDEAPTRPSPDLIEAIAALVSDHSGLPIVRNVNHGAGG